MPLIDSTSLIVTLLLAVVPLATVAVYRAVVVCGIASFVTVST